jgi:hypothetical protein
MILYIIAALLLCAAAVNHMLGNAPEGYEDETGFHYSETKKG